MSRLKTIYTLFSLLLIIVITLESGCNFTKYKDYILDKDDRHIKVAVSFPEHIKFSFQYPSNFRMLDLNKTYDMPGWGDNITHVGFIRPESDKLLESELYVAAFEGEPYQYNVVPTITLDWVLNKPSEKSSTEVKEITVNQIQAKYYKYSLDVDDTLNLYLIAYFEYYGLKWEIFISSYQDIGSKVQSEFFHIVDSFQFIEDSSPSNPVSSR